MDRFSKENHKGFPYVQEGQFFSCAGCQCLEGFLFYRGSYKAILEEYTTLIHFEKILCHAMKNPLAHAVKFAMYG
jgi:hypothetical protein